jgi:hypothetical protein
MAFLNNVGSLVAKILPKVTSTVQSVMASPVGKVGLDILKQLASSAFAKDGSGGVFSDKFQISLPNPLSRLNKLLGNIGSKITSVSDFLSRIGEFLQGNRKLENGTSVNVPSLSDRAATSAKAAASTSADIGAGKYNGALAKSTSASTASGAGSSGGVSASGGASGGSIVGSIGAQAFSTALTGDQQNLLGKVKDPTQRAQMEAQFQMQNYQNLMQFVSNIMRIMGDISKSVISNIR